MGEKYLTIKDLLLIFPHLSDGRLLNIISRPELAQYRGCGRPINILFNEEVKKIILEVDDLFKMACKVKRKKRNR